MSAMKAEGIAMASAELDDSDIAEVVAVLRSGRLALGPKSEEFERRIAEYVGVRHAIAVSSGTAALHLIVEALGLGPGDEVLVPSFTFAASVNALLFAGAEPVFVDIEPETYNLDPEELERKRTERTRAIMAVDIFGHPAEWDEILRFAQQHGLRVIDDSCEALGAEYRGCRLGRFGDAAAFAFYPNKQITTGEGGMVVTDDDSIARLCRSQRNQGRAEMGSWLEHERLGWNYRLDELSAALGVSQLRRIESFLAKRELVARRYTERLKGLSWVRAPEVKEHVRMSWFVYVVTLAEDVERSSVMRFMEARGIPSRAYFSPLHLQPYLRDRGQLFAGSLPVTESVGRRTLALPFHNDLTDGAVSRVVDCLAEAVASAR